MATLDPLRKKIYESVERGMEAMQRSMVMSSRDAISSQVWNWRHVSPTRRTVEGPYSKGTLNESLSIAKIKTTKSIGFSMTWNPVSTSIVSGKQFRYGSLVVTGHPDFFKGDENPEYSARPFIFLLMPKGQRDSSILKVNSGPSPGSLPDDRWQVAVERFNIAFTAAMNR